MRMIDRDEVREAMIAFSTGEARQSSDRAMPRRPRSTTIGPAPALRRRQPRGVLAQGGEFRRVRKAGLIGDEHIGAVLAGPVAARQSADQITVYKSLGHVAQDLASAWALYTAPA